MHHSKSGLLPALLGAHRGAQFPEAPGPSLPHSATLYFGSGRRARSFLGGGALGLVDPLLEEQLDEAIDAAHHRTRVVHDPCRDQRVVNHLLKNHLRRGVVRTRLLQLVQPDHDRVPRIDLHLLRRDPCDRRPRTLLLDHPHHSPELARFVLGDDRRRALEPGRGPHLAQFVGQTGGHPGPQLGGLLLAQLDHALFALGVLVVVCLLVKLDVLRLGADDLALVVRLEVVHHKVVDGVVDEDHLAVVALERLVVRARLGERARGRREVVDLILLGRAPRHVVVERGELAPVHGGRLEVEELGDLGLVVEVAADALLEEEAELGEPLLVRLRLLLGLLV
mmetsp:Transcript_41705/g.111205  ORF Transcript_41705/g.111205 Transcript_41705/m.111205 type:complete len:337 (+) Transcript_41705:161-1171(+)